MNAKVWFYGQSFNGGTRADSEPVRYETQFFCKTHHYGWSVNEDGIDKGCCFCIEAEAAK